MSIEVENLSFSYDGVPLFEDVSFRIERGSKALLVGANGVGKSTLLKLLSKQLVPNSGKVCLRGKVSILSQVTPNLLSETFTCDNLSISVEEWLDSRAAEGKLEFDMVYKIIRALQLPASHPVQFLSEGEKFKLNLCMSLLQPGVDILLLDEPTSHMDLNAQVFLQCFIRTCPFTCVIVSHDVLFVEEIHCTTVLELDISTKSLRKTTASFEDYVKEREIRKEIAKKEALAKEKRVKSLTLQVTNLHEAGVRGSHFQSDDGDKLQRDLKRERAGRSLHKAGVKQRQLERKLEEEEGDVPGNGLVFQLPTSTVQGDRNQFDANSTLSLKDAVLGRDSGDGLLKIGPITANICLGEKVVLFGPNGSGKSTMLASLLGKIPLLSGSLEKGRNLRVGSLDQEEGCGLDQLETPLNLLHRISSSVDVAGSKEKNLAKLKQVGICKRMATEPINKLSPGLKVRLALLRLVVLQVNLLLLDEVTNFVDRTTKESLMDFLANYSGAIICVTHDRELIFNLAHCWTRCWEIDQDSQFHIVQVTELKRREDQARALAQESVNVLW